MPNAAAGQPSSSAEAPRGMKLFLKDGSFQLVREYQVVGDRVRYYSLDSSQWEMIPAALVDWDATKKAETETARRNDALLSKVNKQEQERRAEPLDIDASLEVAPGIFLPPGENLFVFDGKGVFPLPQAPINSKLSKGRLLEQVLVPVPIIPTRHEIAIPGSHAKFRIDMLRPEFYLRVTEPREPDIELIRTKVQGGKRHVENLDELFGKERATGNTLPMQIWTVARGVFRFTLGQPLQPGEYVLAEMVPGEGMSLYVWDFGVDPPPAGKPQ